MYDEAFLWIYLTVYYFCNKSSMIDVPCSIIVVRLGLRKYWNFQSEAKLKQIVAIVTTHSVFLLISANDKYQKNFIVIVSYRWTLKEKADIFENLWRIYSNSIKVCSICVIRLGFFNIWKINMKKESNLDLQVFHLKKTSNARISLSLRQGNSRIARLSDGKKNYC